MGGNKSHVIHWGGDKHLTRHSGCPRDTNDPDDPRLCSGCKRVVVRRIARKAGR